jgi:uncharacterized protein (DUF2237 family)
MFKPINVFGESLKLCSANPITGFYRDGSCNSGVENPAWHTVCILATEEFLAFSKSVGNDLSTPIPEYRFDGVKSGQKWCLAAGNFMRAVKAGNAPQVYLESTHQAILEYISLDELKKYAI